MTQQKTRRLTGAMMPDSISRDRAGRIFHSRHATTLVEVLGTLSVLLVLGVSAASILGSITQVGVRSNRAMQDRASVERLAKVFRQDVNRASEITASDTQAALDVSTESATVRYQWNAKLVSIVRTVSEGENQLSIDMFEMSNDFQPVFSVTDNLVVLRFNDGDNDGDNAGDNAGAKRRRWVIEATRL